MALVVVGCLVVLAASVVGIMLQFSAAQQEGLEASAVFDGLGANTVQDSARMTAGSVLSGFFREPFETVVFIFRDGSFLTFSTNDEKSVAAPTSWLVESIQKTGRVVPGIVFCVHNHFSPLGFTPGDRDAYRYLKGKGFRGVFGIYYTATGKFREIGEK